MDSGLSTTDHMIHFVVYKRECRHIFQLQKPMILGGLGDVAFASLDKTTKVDNN